MRQDDEDKQHPKGCGGNREKVDRGHLPYMIPQEGSPSLGGRSSASQQIFGDRRLRDLDSQLEQFSVNAGCSPQGVGLAHVPNQIANLPTHLGSSRSTPRFPCPVPNESSALPAEDSVRLNHLQTSPPAGPESIQHNPQQPVAVVEAQVTRGVLLENRQLVTKGEDLRLQGRTGLETGGYQSEKGNENRAHRGRYHDLTNDRNLCLFRLDGVFGNHRRTSPPIRTTGSLSNRFLFNIHRPRGGDPLVREPIRRSFTTRRLDKCLLIP